MSWFSQKDWSSLAQSAKTALSSAQKTIDRALDIEEEGSQGPSTQGSNTSTLTAPQQTAASPDIDTESFFATFLSPSSSLSGKSESGRTSPANATTEISPTSSTAVSEKKRKASSDKYKTKAASAGSGSSHDGNRNNQGKDSSRHQRSKSSGTVSPVASQKSNGFSSCSESIEVLSLLSSEKNAESFCHDFTSPPKLNVLHNALTNTTSSTDSAANQHHSPRSSSDDAGLEPASPDDAPLECVSDQFHNFGSPLKSEELTNVQLDSLDVAQENMSSSSSNNRDNRVQSWFMVTDSLNNSTVINNDGVTVNESSAMSYTFQPDLVPVTDEDSFVNDESVESNGQEQDTLRNFTSSSQHTVTSTNDTTTTTVTPPDVQQISTESPMPDVQLNVPTNPPELEVDSSQIEYQIPDLTSSSRERPDIFPPQSDNGSTVQGLDVIQAGDGRNEMENSDLTLTSEDPLTLASGDTLAPITSDNSSSANTVDLVVQELDVVQGNEGTSSNAVTSLDILPTNRNAIDNPTSPDFSSNQQMSIINNLPASHMDRNGSTLASYYEENPNERSVVIDELLQRISALEETVQAREQQLFSVNRRATDALEENEELRSQIETNYREFEEEKNRMIEKHQLELNTTTIKYNSSQQRLKEMEKQLNDLKNASSFSVQLQNSLNEKDAIIEELRKEGEKLAQEEYKKNSVIKKLKTKEKELQTSLDKTKSLLEEKTTELQSYTDSFTKLQQKVSEQRETINQMNSTMTKNEQLLSRRTNENEELFEKTNALQNNLDSVFRELKEAQQQLADKEAQLAQSKQSVNEEAIWEKEEALKSAHKKWDEEKEILSQQLQDANTSHIRMEQAANRREQLLKDELNHLQMRLEEEMQRGQGLSEGVSQATQPLWTQISRLQRQQQDQQSQWAQLEANYQERLAEAESRAGQAAECERLANEVSIELKCRLSSLEAQLDTVRNEHSKLIKLSEQKGENLKQLDEQVSKLKDELVFANEKLSSSERQISLLNGELSVEKQSHDQLRRKHRTTEEHNRELLIKLKESESGYSNSSSINGKRTSTMVLSSPSEPLVETSVNKSGSFSAATNPRNVSSWEFLESQVKLKDGEATTLQNELRKLEKQNVALREDFIKLSNERHDWLADKEALIQLKTDYSELTSKYETLLTMYGEKAEEVDELKMDLSDVKVIYKAQIEDLVKKLVQSKS